MKKALIECKTEINGLKEMVFQSKNKIEYLQEELENEKKKSVKLRSEIGKQTDISRIRKIDDSNNISNNNISALCDSPVSRVKTPVSSVKRSRNKNRSYDMRESRKLTRMFHSGDKSRDITMDNDQSRIPFDADQSRMPFDADTSRQEILRTFKENPQKQNFITKLPIRHIPQASFGSHRDYLNSLSPRNEEKNKTAQVQCDFMLEKIADFGEEELLEEKQREIEQLTNQVSELKVNYHINF